MAYFIMYVLYLPSMLCSKLLTTMIIPMHDTVFEAFEAYKNMRRQKGLLVMEYLWLGCVILCSVFQNNIEHQLVDWVPVIYVNKNIYWNLLIMKLYVTNTSGVWLEHKHAKMGICIFWKKRTSILSAFRYKNLWKIIGFNITSTPFFPQER